MSDSKTAKPAKNEYGASLYLPRTDFPMRAGLPKREQEILSRWEEIDLYRALRRAAHGRPKYVLHDGPPYANGNIHIGHALNKILKDVITRAMQMLGFDSVYVPGWDCHGLPIEWKIEEQYRAKGQSKDSVDINVFRDQCREFAAHWIEVQTQEFQRLGIVGDFVHPYTTMAFDAEAAIAGELLKFAKSGQVYRGSKPVMWSVVEGTALAEAEVEYHEHKSDAIYVGFPLDNAPEDLEGAVVAIWTTTPWTIPGNRAIAFSNRIAYGAYRVDEADDDNWAGVGEVMLLADALATEVMTAARVESYSRLRTVGAEELQGLRCRHPLHSEESGYYSFMVPLLAGDHVGDDAGTGFVHTAPGHGREDFDLWMASRSALEQAGISPEIPYTVDAGGAFTKDAPGFEGRAVITAKGKMGDANAAVMNALRDQARLIARGRITHQYPHSWRSKKPVIFRNTPQWFIAMDRDIDGRGDTLRARAMAAIEETRFVPSAGKARLAGMIKERPDWVLSRQRAWGVPICLFVHKQTGDILRDDLVDQRIVTAFRQEGADCWFADHAKQRFLGEVYSADEWEQVLDILDVWFDSGATHAYVLEQRPELTWPASLYLEGSDQHRGWFHSSLLESCGTRGRAPYDAVLTHGFTMDEQGRKMSKSLGNQTFPQDVIGQYGADILRLWVMSCDYSEDQRIGPEILKANADAYRRLRNAIRFMLGNLADFDEAEILPYAELDALDQWVLHRLWELDQQVQQLYHEFAFQKLFSALFNFCTVDLSSIYFDIRKDVLYCSRADSYERRRARTVLHRLFDSLVRWLAPMLCFTMEEAWLARYPSAVGSVHLQEFLDIPAEWCNHELGDKFKKIRMLRRVVTGALEVARAEKFIGSSLEAWPTLYVSDPGYVGAMQGVDMAELCITSGISVKPIADCPEGAYRSEEMAEGAAVSVALAPGAKCDRCWRVLEEVGAVSDAPDLCRRCADAFSHRD